MKAKYVKPAIEVTRFLINEAVSVCDVTQYGEAVQVQCLKTQSEWVYTSNNGSCQYTATSLVYFNGGKTDNVVSFMQDGQDGSIDGIYNSGSKELAAGYYLFWADRNPHGGRVPDTTFSNIKNHS